jgi:hypothetical protein
METDATRTYKLLVGLPRIDDRTGGTTRRFCERSGRGLRLWLANGQRHRPYGEAPMGAFDVNQLEDTDRYGMARALGMLDQVFFVRPGTYRKNQSLTGAVRPKRWLGENGEE